MSCGKLVDHDGEMGADLDPLNLVGCDWWFGVDPESRRIVGVGGQKDPWKLESWDDADHDLLKCDYREDRIVVDLERRKYEHPDAWSGPVKLVGQVGHSDADFCSRKCVDPDVVNDPEDPILKKINPTIGPKSFSIILKMVNLEAKNINIMIKIILVMILVNIGFKY